MNRDPMFKVLINAELQYSLWPSGKAEPNGWSVILEASPKIECIDFVERHWCDMRPQSLRESAGKAT